MRKPTPEEFIILSFLFEKAHIKYELDKLLVESMEDGGMGSLRLFPDGQVPEYEFGCNIAECWFKDSDNVPASGALYLNPDNIPLELDMWKVDFSPLKRWPKLEELSLSSTGT